MLTFAMPSMGVVIALGLLAIAVLFLLARLFPGKPKRAEKWEKAAIMKQLLELSEREEALKRPAPVATRLRTSAKGSKPITRPVNAAVKTSLPVHSKIR